MRLQLLTTSENFRLLIASLLSFVVALRAFPTRLLLLRVLSVLHPFLSTARARWILTALVAVPLSTAHFPRDAFGFAGEAMALIASPDQKHHYHHLYCHHHCISIVTIISGICSIIIIVASTISFIISIIIVIVIICMICIIIMKTLVVHGAFPEPSQRWYSQ